jgi:hypothetical protein
MEMNVSFAMIVIMLAVITQFQTTHGIDKFLIDFPEPFTDHNRIFLQVLNYDLHHIDSLYLNIAEYLSMCEGGWTMTVLIHTCANYSAPLLHDIIQRSYCYRTSSHLNITVRQYDKGVGIWLAAPHRLVVKDEILNHDFFVYQEDDMIFKYSLLTAHLHETKTLQSLLYQDGLADYCIGYHRYVHLRHHKDEKLDGDNVVKNTINEMPIFDHICLGDKPYVTVHDDEVGIHQAVWALTRQQLLVLQDRCKYLQLFTGER